METTNQISKNRITFKNFLRFVFVLFSLYLMGDAFFRWDGFSYYATFSEFLPAAALALILWSIVSVFTALFLWILFRLFERISNLMGVKISIEHLLLCACLFILSGALIWKVKRLIWPDAHTTILIKLAVLFLVSGVSVLMTWLLHDRARRWARIISERIVPLVWIFSICLVLAVPVVAYNTWFKGADSAVSKKKLQNISADKTRPNIIMITFDALAARNMSAYGYDRDTTPFIKQWAENATLFANAEANSNFTTPSVASLMTGKRVWTHQTYHIEGSIPVKSNIESLPSELKKHGYYNMAFVVNPFASVRVLGMAESFAMAPLASEFANSASLFGWKFGIIDKLLYNAFGERIRFHNWIFSNEFILSKLINIVSRNINQTEVPPEKTFNQFLDSIDNNLPRPFFAWIHLFPPHDPYLPPEPYKEMYSSSLELRSYKEQERLIEESYKYLFQSQPYPEEMREAVNVMRNHYDESIRYVDKTFENFIEDLNKRPLENTIIILSSDHGESFEHGYFTHGGPFLYEQVTHVPLIIKESGQVNGKVVNSRVEQIDIPATILDIANIEVPSWMEGRSLLPLIKGNDLPQRPAFSMNFQENRSGGNKITNGTIAVWEGDYKLIHYLDNGKSLLFNLRQDPGEMVDLFSTEPETADHMHRLVKENIDKANENIKRQSHYQ